MNERIGRQAARQGLAQKMLLGSGIVGGILGAGGGLLSGLDIDVPQPLVFGGSLVVVVALFWVSVIYWRNIDEAAREAHKFAWFWGGTGGILAILPLSVLVSSERLVAVLGPQTPSAWIAFGFVSLLIAQLAGYGLVWVAWWLRQR